VDVYANADRHETMRRRWSSALRIGLRLGIRRTKRRYSDYYYCAIVSVIAIIVRVNDISAQNGGARAEGLSLFVRNENDRGVNERDRTISSTCKRRRVPFRRTVREDEANCTN